jgi:predicted DNA-binding transcriptional regulator YafY
MSYVPDVKILSPEDIKQKMQDQLKQALSLYDETD